MKFLNLFHHFRILFAYFYFKFSINALFKKYHIIFLKIWSFNKLKKIFLNYNVIELKRQTSKTQLVSRIIIISIISSHFRNEYKYRRILWIIVQIQKIYKTPKIYLTQFHKHYFYKYSYSVYPNTGYGKWLHVRETGFSSPYSLQMDKRRQLGKFRWARIPLRAHATANVKQRSRYACAVAEKWEERALL